MGDVSEIGAREVLTALRSTGVQAGDPVAFAPARSPDGKLRGLGLAAGDRTFAVTVTDPATAGEAVRAVRAELAPRWVWWSSREAAAPPLLDALAAVPCWDLAAVHRLLHGGGAHDPARVWAAVQELPEDRLPRAGQLDLLTSADTAGPEGDPDHPVRPDGYLHPDWTAGAPAVPARAARWATLALTTRAAQLSGLAALPDGRAEPREPALPVLTAWAESAAELLAVELTARGLPLDRAAAERLITDRIGPRASDAATDLEQREHRDDEVRRHVPGGQDVDLRNPAQVRSLLARIGIDVPDTRSWRLEPFRSAHPAVEALLSWRKAERIATTYGYSWLDRHVGPDGRLRGAWTGSDGAAGRMTAQAGLHNLPTELRPAVAAEPGHVFVRADLGQIEPRVLAAVSGDEAFAQATLDADLYSPVAARLGCARPTAKVAVLAAMYGQTSGTAGAALEGLDRAYPVAMRHLRAAEERGRAGQDVRTHGGRLVRMWPLPEPVEPAALAARGRYARNAVIQGSAAELFKMWAVTVRAALGGVEGSEIVMCLHDELLVHVPDSRAAAVAALLQDALAQTAARWASGSPVRFVVDVSVVRRWSDAKGATGV